VGPAAGGLQAVQPVESPSLDLGVAVPAWGWKGMRLELVVTDLLESYLKTSAERMEIEVERAQSDLCTQLGVDRATLWRVASRQEGSFALVHSCGPQAPAPEPRLDLREALPWTLSEVLEGRVVACTRLADLPAGAAVDRETWRRWRTPSSLVLPLAVAGEVLGLLALESVRAEREWPAELVADVLRAARMFTLALVRSRARRVVARAGHVLRAAAPPEPDAMNRGRGRRGLEEALLETWILLEAVVDDTPDPVCCVDLRSSTLVAWNDAFADRFLGGLGRQARPGPPLRELFLTGEPRGLWSGLLERAATGGAFTTEAVVAADGEVVPLSFRPLGNDGEVFAVLVAARRPVSSEAEPAAGEAERWRRCYLQAERQKERLQAERDYLAQKASADHVLGVLGHSTAMQQVLARVAEAAPTASPVLVSGERGSGKELIAHAIHRLSSRQSRTLVAVRCAELAAAYREWLFGRGKDAEAGAFPAFAAWLDLADGSTLLLEEISDLPLDLQAELLGVLDERSPGPGAAAGARRRDVRLVATTTRDLREEVRRGGFRYGLYDRLSACSIAVPPLRARPDDIPLLVRQFADHFGRVWGRAIQNVPAELLDDLRAQPWLGNVDELRSVVERAVLLSTGGSLAAGVPGGAAEGELEPLTLEEIERRHIRRVLAMTHGRISGPGGAAELLGLNRTTLQSKLKRLGIARRRPR
jgi:formate hydrogenlyase transcriptional activator